MHSSYKTERKNKTMPNLQKVMELTRRHHEAIIFLYPEGDVPEELAETFTLEQWIKILNFAPEWTELKKEAEQQLRRKAKTCENWRDIHQSARGTLKKDAFKRMLELAETFDDFYDILIHTPQDEKELLIQTLWEINRRAETGEEWAKVYRWAHILFTLFGSATLGASLKSILRLRRNILSNITCIEDAANAYEIISRHIRPNEDRLKAQLRRIIIEMVGTDETQNRITWNVVWMNCVDNRDPKTGRLKRVVLRQKISLATSFEDIQQTCAEIPKKNPLYKLALARMIELAKEFEDISKIIIHKKDALKRSRLQKQAIERMIDLAETVEECREAYTKAYAIKPLRNKALEKLQKLDRPFVEWNDAYSMIIAGDGLLKRLFFAKLHELAHRAT